MNGPESLDAPGIRVRAWRAEDASAVEAIRADPTVSRWSGLRDEDAAAWIARQSNREDGVSLAVTRPPSETALGKVALGHHDAIARQAELSYWVIPVARGRRLASGACRALCGWAFAVAGLQRIVLDIEVDNEPSKAVARALGATPDPGSPHAELDQHGVARQLVRWVIT